MRRSVALCALVWSLIVPLNAQNWWGSKRLPPPVPSGPPEWDTQTAAHLLRRAGFSAPPDEVERFVEQGFEASLQEVLNPELIDDSAMEAGLLAQNYQLKREAPNMDGLQPVAPNMQRWWTYRMINTKRPLVEKMTYFLHDHFATSLSTVRQVTPAGDPLMMLQNELLRQYALGNFKGLVHQIARDPAMIYWLDNDSNVKGHPNENWARELMELFTMGIGNYTETDIQEAARTVITLSISFFPRELPTSSSPGNYGNSLPTRTLQPRLLPNWDKRFETADMN
jgi:hypothetical protein